MGQGWRGKNTGHLHVLWNMDQKGKKIMKKKLLLFDYTYITGFQFMANKQFRMLWKKIGNISVRWYLTTCSQKPIRSIFKASALWADAFYKSKCPYVCLFVCLCVCLSVCLFTFEVPFNGLFAPTSRSRMSNIFEDLEEKDDLPSESVN